MQLMCLKDLITAPSSWQNSEACSKKLQHQEPLAPLRCCVFKTSLLLTFTHAEEQKTRPEVARAWGSVSCRVLSVGQRTLCPLEHHDFVSRKVLTPAPSGNHKSPPGSVATGAGAFLEFSCKDLDLQ